MLMQNLYHRVYSSDINGKHVYPLVYCNCTSTGKLLLLLGDNVYERLLESYHPV